MLLPTAKPDEPRRKKLEIQTFVDQRAHPALTLIAQLPERFARQGAVIATWRGTGERRHGPYFQLAYREEGRQRRVYLGTAGPVVEAVRGALERLQRPLRGLREFRRMRRKLTASLREAKQNMAGQFARLGLRLKGYEVRGWRSVGLGRLDATALDRQKRAEPAAPTSNMRGIVSVLATFGLRPPRLPSVPRPPSPAQLVGRLMSRLLPMPSSACCTSPSLRL